MNRSTAAFLVLSLGLLVLVSLLATVLPVSFPSFLSMVIVSSGFLAVLVAAVKCSQWLNLRKQGQSRVASLPSLWDSHGFKVGVTAFIFCTWAFVMYGWGFLFLFFLGWPVSSLSITFICSWVFTYFFASQVFAQARRRIWNKGSTFPVLLLPEELLPEEIWWAYIMGELQLNPVLQSVAIQQRELSLVKLFSSIAKFPMKLY